MQNFIANMAMIFTPMIQNKKGDTMEKILLRITEKLYSNNKIIKGVNQRLKLYILTVLLKNSSIFVCIVVQKYYIFSLTHKKQFF